VASISMREVVFHVLQETPGHLQARSDDGLQITAASLEELHLEAREALMQHLGPAHVAFRIRLSRSRSPHRSAPQPPRRLRTLRSCSC
jgi:hypothetical protein